ncbi:MAG: A/G-specific adenine glycosylase, partial [Microbacterium sp.]
PLRDGCAWVAAGRPDTGDTRRRQAGYEGSDRQARGVVLRMLREAPARAVPLAALQPRWPDAAQLDRAVSSLIADGLAEADGEMLSLPA